MSTVSGGVDRAVTLHPSQLCSHALDDEVYAEFIRLLDGMPDVMALPDNERGGLQAVFSVACDRDVDRTPFIVGGNPRCPNCGSHEMETWRSTNPPEIVDVDVPHVTHEWWISKTLDDRKALVRRAVDVFLATGQTLVE
jgi:hypothetical protein